MKKGGRGTLSSELNKRDDDLGQAGTKLMQLWIDCGSAVRTGLPLAWQQQAYHGLDEEVRRGEAVWGLPAVQDGLVVRSARCCRLESKRDLPVSPEHAKLSRGGHHDRLIQRIESTTEVWLEMPGGRTHTKNSCGLPTGEPQSPCDLLDGGRPEPWAELS